MRNRYARRVPTRQCEWRRCARRKWHPVAKRGARTRSGCMEWRSPSFAECILLTTKRFQSPNGDESLRERIEPVVDLSDIREGRPNDWPPRIPPRSAFAILSARDSLQTVASNSHLKKSMRPIDVVLAATDSVTLLLLRVWSEAHRLPERLINRQTMPSPGASPPFVSFRRSSFNPSEPSGQSAGETVALRHCSLRSSSPNADNRSGNGGDKFCANGIAHFQAVER